MATVTGPTQMAGPKARATALSPYIMDGVEDLNEVIGHGSYAVVKKLKFRGLECVGKKMHDILYLNATPQQRKDMLTRFQGECELLSRLHHPCIVQFMGVYFEEGTPLPILVMERLHSTLAAAIDRYGVLPDQICYGVLCDVSLGLRYLHEHSPPIIHRDLSANNVLLTPHMSAKISDLGVAKIVNLSLSQMTQLVQTKAPGTPCYMPPEALTSRPKYNTKIDIYSMGVMLIHVFCGEWPFPTDVFQPDPRNPDSLVPVTEVERRAEFLRKIGEDHPLTPLMRRCLSNNPTLRPAAAQMCAQLTEVKGHFPATAEMRIDTIQQLQSFQDEVVGLRIALIGLEEQALGKEKELETLRKQLSSVSLKGSPESTILSTEKVQLLHPLSKLQWRRCADMPVGEYGAQAVVIGDEVYVGGGFVDSGDNDNNINTDNGHRDTGNSNSDNDSYISVVKYNVAKDEWTRLSNHCVYYFGLCQFQGNLVSVGGVSLADDLTKNLVYRYSLTDRKWVVSLKPMPTARALPTLLTTASAIIACGGGTKGKDGKNVTMSTVEVYSSTTSQWHTADPLPQPCAVMTATIISGYGFLLGGGFVEAESEIKTIKSVFCFDTATLIDRAISPTTHHETTPTWKTLPDTPLWGSAAATLSGGLLAVGGKDEDEEAAHFVCTVYMFTPSTNSWVKLPSGDLPEGRAGATAVQLSNNRVMVIGGVAGDTLTTCYICSVTYLHMTL